MQIAVLGAAGGVGRHVVDRLQQRGHRVRAVIRRPPGHDRWAGVEIATADVLDPDAVAAALAGCDGAVWAVGGHDVARRALAGHRRQADLCATGTGNVLQALADRAPARFVVVSSWGVGDSRQRLPLAFRYVVAPVLLRAELADKQRQEELVRASDLAWTIVRPSRLTNADTTRYRVGARLRYTARSSTSRRSVADFVARCLDQSLHVFETVEITSGR
jgi:uncharacterized protein YbjT (DUF2867 family)